MRFVTSVQFDISLCQQLEIAYKAEQQVWHLLLDLPYHS